MNDEGIRVEKDEDMRTVVLEYFVDIFTTVSNGDLGMDVTSPRIVSHDQNMELVADMTVEKFTEAIH